GDNTGESTDEEDSGKSTDEEDSGKSTDEEDSGESTDEEDSGESTDEVPTEFEEPIVLYNGKVYTASEQENQKWKEAVAIKNGKFVAVGDSQQVLQANQGGTRIDLEGRLVVPGLNDAHVHLLPGALGQPINNPVDFIPGPGPTIEDMEGMIASVVSLHPAGTWLYGSVGEEFIEDQRAHRDTLDAVSPDHPVVLQNWAGHNLYINTKAMETMGLDEYTPDPFGGYYGRYSGTGAINGVLYEYAEYEFIRRIRLTLTTEQIRDLFLEVLGTLPRLGITSVQNMDWLPWDKLEEIFEDTKIPVRVRLICFPVDPDEAQECQPPPSGANIHNMVTFKGVKWILDGTPVERLAALIDPYTDAPSEYGYSVFPEEEYEDVFDEAINSGAPGVSQRLYHAIGDRAVTNVLAAMDAVAPDGQWRPRRVRIEHGDMIRPDQIERLVSMGVMVVQNPTHFALPALYMARFGPERVATVQPLKSLIEGGVVVALGSDAIGPGGNPFVDMMFAVLHPTNPAEAITMEQALVAYTRNAAYAEFAEKHKGEIKNGKFADLAVL
ncbi:MAG: amidohydrolase family protein, partial [Propionibacteriaceae bacterium]|nr:amidohydrolase family protein [Propionibacteriaceae bacterium]